MGKIKLYLGRGVIVVLVTVLLLNQQKVNHYLFIDRMSFRKVAEMRGDRKPMIESLSFIVVFSI